MKVIYIAGKYRDNRGEYFVMWNVRIAEEMAVYVWTHGAMAYCPHKNTERFGGLCPNEVWMKGDIELLSRCDAVWAIYNWKDSPGAMEEVAFAKEHNIPVLFTHQDVIDFIGKDGQP